MKGGIMLFLILMSGLIGVALWNLLSDKDKLDDMIAQYKNKNKK